jgi:hypothetical protein
MFRAGYYRAKAVEYTKLLNDPHPPAEVIELRNLEQTYTTLADNEEWLARNADKDKIVQTSHTMRQPRRGAARTFSWWHAGKKDE